MRRLIILIVLFFFNNKIHAQLKFECECHYRSSFELKSYLSTIDSIVNKVRNDKNEIVQVIGYRAFAAAEFVVVVNRNNITKAFDYSLTTKKLKVVTGAHINMWVQCMARDSAFRYIVNTDPFIRPSHDWAYFVSLRYPLVPVKEICYSVLLSNIRQPFSECLMSFVSYLMK
ncbi:hypothetical protein SAMN05216311_12313 [Chitinophaga sp. CF418]|nr:hypothetical protein SAMN05216311_12313 [Chitinophaga sp. CF418]